MTSQASGADNFAEEYVLDLRGNWTYGDEFLIMYFGDLSHIPDVLVLADEEQSFSGDEFYPTE